MARHPSLLAAWIALAFILVALLFRFAGIGVDDLIRALGMTPAWLLGASVAVAFLNQLVGVARWRTALAWLSPSAPALGILPMLEATTWGSIAGQVLPPQLSMTAARWSMARHPSAIGTTLYEQLFDFMVLAAGAAAATAVLALKLGPVPSIAFFAIALLGGCLAIRWLTHVGHILAARYVRTGYWGVAFAARLDEPLVRASRAPAHVLGVLFAWSVIRLALMTLRVVLIVGVFAPAADWTTVAIGYPISGLAMAIPILPAGLGLAEWSWTGLLVVSGATAAAAALTALIFRVINFAGLAAVLLALVLLRLARFDNPVAVRPSRHG